MSSSEATPLPLLELFVSDTRDHAAVLKRGLVELAEDASQQPALLPGLLLAAHSIRGAAKIVGFEPAALVAEAVEATLHEAERSGTSIHPILSQPLLGAVESLDQMVAAGAASLRDWASGQLAYVARVLNDLKPGVAWTASL